MNMFKSAARRVLHAGMPVPFAVRPVVRLVYFLGVAVAGCVRMLYAWLVAGPVFKSIASVGAGLRIERVPYIRGRGKIEVGSGVYISGKIDIAFPRHAATLPALKIGDRTFIGHLCRFGCAREISIGSDCLLGSGVRIQDSDGHPVDPVRRRAGEPVDPKDVEPVIVEENVWIAPGCTILKGVTIGRNSVVGAGSIVAGDVPSNAVVAGNPARVIRLLQ